MTIVRTVAIASLLGVIAAAPAAAQTPRATGPFSGLFGAQSTWSQTLDLRGSLFGAYSETLLPDDVDRTLLSPEFETTRLFSGASAGLSYAYTRSADESSFFVGGRGSVSQTSIRPEALPYRLSADTGLSTRLGLKSRLSVGANAGYSPYFNFGISEEGFNPNQGFGRDPSLDGPAFSEAALDRASVHYGASSGLAVDLTPRSSLSFNADWAERQLVESGESTATSRYGTQTYSGSAAFTRRLTRNLGLNLGYGRRVSASEQPGADPVANDSINAGLNYSGSLPLGRRTEATFGSSTSIVRHRGGSRFRLNGNVGISHGMGRTWSLAARYARSAGFDEGFDEPVLSDSVIASLSGQIAPRLSWSSSASWRRGEVGFDSGEHFDTYQASSGLHLGLFQFLGLYAQYAYFGYRVPPGSTSLPLLSRFSRQTVSAGLTTWLPIFQTGRIPRDSR